jgi:NADH:ubiquinone oxidoreductase subunit F (NADH-binding)
MRASQDFQDRLIVERDPHSILKAIIAHMPWARTAFVYIRGEFFSA